MKKAAKKKTKAASKSKTAARKPARKPATKPAPRAARAPASRAPGGDGATDRGRYTPQEIPGTGWPPFRYPPS
jgi:hypothetical protein